ncbi:hypothetical protein Cni_G16358 [Canna indica]|uniref:Uncharacterized protein n=1 Tax=Canna indica TaxID=4628 RepID=A0AAQ3KEX6_9LILI|nr:hypothetical protein Cni_G16358 [Canna indica]
MDIPEQPQSTKDMETVQTAVSPKWDTFMHLQAAKQQIDPSTSSWSTDTSAEARTAEQTTSCRTLYQINSLAKAANKVILTLFKKKLNQVKIHWPDELWGYNAIAQSCTPENPYMPAFGAEAIITAETTEPSFPRITLDERNTSESPEDELDPVKEERKLAQAREEATSPF